MTYSTPQERFWAGAFGDAYIQRNKGDDLLKAKTAMFRAALRKAAGVTRVVELGCNIGLNLVALKQLLGSAGLSGVEINAAAAAEARANVQDARIIEGSLFDYRAAEPHDLAFTCGVLIHLQPEKLPVAYRRLAEASSKYVLIAEYYNPVPVSVDYRGESDRLFKRDFAGEFLDQHPDFRLLDYGFVYRRDPEVPLDDITWFLLSR